VGYVRDEDAEPLLPRTPGSV